MEKNQKTVLSKEDAENMPQITRKPQEKESESRTQNESTAKTKTDRPLHPNPSNSQKPRLKILGPYEFSFEDRLGSGMTADVYKGKNRQTGQEVCIKIIDKLTFKRKEQHDMLDNQIKCQEKALSESVVRIYDIFDTNSFTFIVLQYCEGGDLYRMMRDKKQPLEEKHLRKYAYSVAKALLRMKNNGIIHRDIKSQNILIKKGIAKLGDFGFAIDQKNIDTKFNLGSPLYMSPEVLDSNKYSYKSDVYAFGIMLYQLLHGRTPWECTDEAELKRKTKEEKIVWGDVSEEIRQVIQGCLELNPDERWQIEDIMKSKLWEEQEEGTAFQ